MGNKNFVTDDIHHLCSSVCSESDLKEVVSRLRDWFRVLHENGNHKRVKTQKPEKNSKLAIYSVHFMIHTDGCVKHGLIDCSPQSWRWEHLLSVRTLLAGCSPVSTQISTCSWTSRKSRVCTWTGTSPALTCSSNPVTHTRTKSLAAPSGAHASRDTQV